MNYMNKLNPNGYQSILVTGGGGYVGSALVPALAQQGYRVKVVDTFWYGQDVFGEANQHPNIDRIPLDIRQSAKVAEALKGVDVVIHLACISNDPSFELDPTLGKSINYDAFAGLLQGSIYQGVKRFIYASSSSIYGVKETPDVREDAEPLPLTDYSKFKLACERDLLAHPKVNGMERVIVRPSTVCGYAPRLRLDLSVNILTISALMNHKIRIFGGKQLRPNLHIKDMVRAYQMFLEAPGHKIDKEPFNVGFQNRSIEDIAKMVVKVLNDPSIELEYTPSSDNRSYHVNSEKVKRVLGFETRYTIEDAIKDITEAYHRGLIVNPLANALYSNIKRMQELHVK